MKGGALKYVSLRHVFMDSIPDDIEDGVIYVSTKYPTAIHRCCCGCGARVVTPIKPTSWTLTFDGKTISLHPSIGIAGRCNTHYWIKNNRAIWAPPMTDATTKRDRARANLRKERHYGTADSPSTQRAQRSVKKDGI
jgi:hypothetical protein